MEYESRMEQHYAVSKTGMLTHINNAHNRDEDFYCPYCGCRMMKKCGSIRAWHFAHNYHQNNIQKECSYESYLHAYAKLRLQQWFNESPSIKLHYRHGSFCKHDRNCIWQQSNDECSIYEVREYDLKKSLTNCTLEETVNIGGETFRADLYWNNPDRPKNNILIEINVTHQCTTKKKNSMARIIEFDVYSEDDVDYIISNDIRESEMVRFFGFNPNNNVADMPAKYLLNKFIYYRSGNAFARSQCDCRSYLKRRSSALVEITVREHNKEVIGSLDSIEEISYGKLYNWGLSFAKKYGFSVRNCYLCLYHKYSFDNDVLTCDLKADSECEPKDASRCSDYCVDNSFCDKNLSELNEFIMNECRVVDVWVQK